MNHTSSIKLGFCSVAIAFAYFMTSCSGSQYLKTSVAEPSEVTGAYTLILYGCRYSSDVENVAILARDAGNYTFEVYAPDFDYKIERHIPAKEALERAANFVRCHYAFWRAGFSGIVTPEGKVIGYEVRPLYSTLEFGQPDILDINYLIKDNSKVTVSIALKRELRRVIDRDDPIFFRMRR